MARNRNTQNQGAGNTTTTPTGNAPANPTPPSNPTPQQAPVTPSTPPKPATSSKKYLYLAGALLAVIVLILVLIYSFGGGDSKTDESSSSVVLTPHVSKIYKYSAGDEINIPEEGVDYRRIAGFTYWEATSDHIIFVAEKTGEKYYFGPSNTWEPERPGGRVIKIPPPTLNYRLYPNKNYGTKTAVLQISKITPNNF